MADDWETQKQKLDYEIAEFDLATKKAEQTPGRRFGKALATNIPLIVALIVPLLGYVQFQKSLQATYAQFQQSVDVANTARTDTARLETQTQQFKAAIDGGKTLFAKKVEYYDETIRVTGTLRTLIHDFGPYPQSKDNSNNKKYKTMRDDFEHLYWSKLPLVEDDEVEEAMITYRFGLFYLEAKSDRLKRQKSKRKETEAQTRGFKYDLDNLTKQYKKRLHKNLPLDADWGLERALIIESLSILVARSMRDSLQGDINPVKFRIKNPTDRANEPQTNETKSSAH